jgi:WD40 repeat protein
MDSTSPCAPPLPRTQVKYNRQNPNELASSHGEYVHIWDDRKGSVPVTIVRAHNQKIYGIDYSRKKADRLVTCSLDSTVKVRCLLSRLAESLRH